MTKEETLLRCVSCYYHSISENSQSWWWQCDGVGLPHRHTHCFSVSELKQKAEIHRDGEQSPVHSLPGWFGFSPY